MSTLFYMNFSEKESYILNWIHEVSKIRKELDGFAICPFSSQAKYKIIECCVKDIKPIENYDVIIFIVEDNLSIDNVRYWVNYLNSQYSNWKFFEDFKCYDTYIQKIKTNNGRYNLILAQPKLKLRNYREKLAKTSYYKLWDEEYLKEILEDDYDVVQNRDSNPLKSSDLQNQEEKND